jgi:murein DD-endopeptidase MepM/ murein hydrolase activator NlpD
MVECTLLKITSTNLYYLRPYRKILQAYPNFKDFFPHLYKTAAHGGKYKRTYQRETTDSNQTKENIMWENFKESEFGKKIIKIFSNKGVVITTALVVLVLTVAITATVATNRANKQNAELGSKLPTDTTQQTQKAPDTDALGKGEDTVPVYNEGNGTEQVIEKVEGFALPVQGTLGAKHDASVQVWSPTMEEYRIHLGIDITTEDAAPVYAAAAGTVAQIWDDPMMGTCVAISHEGDVVTIYKNLAANLADGIVAGKEVKSGQQIGTVGGTATLEMAEAPHLHFEMTEGGLSVDPLEYFSDKDVKTLNTYEDATEGK